MAERAERAATEGKPPHRAPELSAHRHEAIDRRTDPQGYDVLLNGRPAGPQPLQPAPNRTGLPDRLKAGVESLSGLSMDGVKVHYNSSKPAQLEAHAFTQGSEIHLAPGQERHLPHEAWHVVQQAQGRVRQTRQAKGGLPLNDEAGLEREADAMGARAGGESLPSASRVARRPSSRRIAQAYSIEREPDLKVLYSVSDDRKIVTGMGTPNHDLFVDEAGKIDAINQAAKQSLLLFRSGGPVNIFGRAYLKVAAGFQTVVLNPSKQKVDIDQVYHAKVAPAINKESSDKYTDAISTIIGEPWVDTFRNIQGALSKLIPALELFKKLVIANQAKPDYSDENNDMGAPSTFVIKLEQLLYSDVVTQAQIEEVGIDLAYLASIMRIIFRNDENLLQNIEELWAGVQELTEKMPADLPVNLRIVQSVSYQEAMRASIQAKDPMFYRACDVMASTLMGNKLTEENKDQLKIYGAGQGGAFHYAARILKSGADWITLESFAAGDREREVLGITEANAGKNLDNSWQYMMYGSVKKADQDGSEEDNAFELYTKLRYRLKGIEAVGRFRTDQRDRLTATVRRDSFAAISGITEDESLKIFEALVLQGILTSAGKVKAPQHLEASDIASRLSEHADKASAISARLKELLGEPQPAATYVQGPPSNEMGNIAAWFKLIGLPVDTDEMSARLGGELASGTDPKLVHNMAWKELLLAIEESK